MNYAIRTDEVYTAHKPVKTKRKMSIEQKAARQFMKSHTVSVSYDKKSGKAVIDVVGKNP